MIKDSLIPLILDKMNLKLIKYINNQIMIIITNNNNNFLSLMVIKMNNKIIIKIIK
jgi:hypothetical protein